MKSKLLRTLAGFGVILAVLVFGYLLILRPLHARWGSTAAERSLPLPGDEGLPQPVHLWTRSLTINAPPEAIYPWLVQIGQGRGGFYSYDWLENLLGFNIHSAQTILPEFQNPPVDTNIPLFPGGDFVRVRSFEPGRSFVMHAISPDGTTIFWIWSLNLLPVDADTTRLVIRNRMGDASPAGDPGMAPMFAVLEPLDVVMELKMMQVLKLRAEGRAQGLLVTPLEILTWLAALAIGFAAGVRVLKQADWRGPLWVGAVAVLLLLYFTFLYPPLWLRLGLVSALLAGLLWAWERKPRMAADLGTVPA